MNFLDIPAFSFVYKETKVYGTFRWANYSLSGNILYEADEGGGIEVAYFQKTGNVYKVKKIMHPRDGGLRLEDMMELCEGDKN